MALRARTVRGSGILLAVIATACSGDDGPGRPSDAGGDPKDGSSDAAPSACIRFDASVEPAPCWPTEPPPVTISVELGTGEDAFEPMPDAVPSVCGPQSGFHIVVHSRVSGIDPGDPRDILCPSNPSTRVRGYFADSGVFVGTSEVGCGSRLGYVKDGDSYVLSRSSAVIFDSVYQEPDIFGKEIRLVLEVIDKDGNYGINERTVTALPPTDWADAGPTSSGCGT